MNYINLLRLNDEAEVLSLFKGSSAINEETNWRQ